MSGLVFLPLATPEVVLGAALLGWFLTLTFARGFVTVIIAHVMFTLGYVVVTIRARLEGMDLHIEEAAMDLGAGQWTTIRKITLPLIMPGIAAAGLLAFAISIDDFVVTNFNAGPTRRSRCSSTAPRAGRPAAGQRPRERSAPRRARHDVRERPLGAPQPSGDRRRALITQALPVPEPIHRTAGGPT